MTKNKPDGFVSKHSYEFLGAGYLFLIGPEDETRTLPVKILEWQEWEKIRDAYNAGHQRGEDVGYRKGLKDGSGNGDL